MWDDGKWGWGWKRELAAGSQYLMPDTEASRSCNICMLFLVWNIQMNPRQNIVTQFKHSIEGIVSEKLRELEDYCFFYQPYRSICLYNIMYIYHKKSTDNLMKGGSYRRRSVKRPWQFSEMILEGDIGMWMDLKDVLIILSLRSLYFF